LEELSSANTTMQELMAEVDKAPLPEGVQRLLDQAGKQSGDATAADNVVPLRPRDSAPLFQMPAALAAGVTLVVGFLVGNFMSTPAPQGLTASVLSSGAVATNSPLHALLDETASGVEIDLDGNASATAILSFENTEGRYCRQFRVDGAAESGHAVACQRDNTWQLDTIAFAAAPSGAFSPASANVPASVDAAVDRLLADGEPLSPDQESDLISQGWD
ncbi:MAG: hypothetical protein KJP03_00005, partial [Gammaproteobacteria bacterium]|nr:hypothetical protein [Gammaproteobacteria bacterium]